MILQLKQIRIFLLINKQYSYKKGKDNDLKTSLMSSESHKFFNNKLKEEWWYETIKEEDP